MFLLTCKFAVPNEQLECKVKVEFFVWRSVGYELGTDLTSTSSLISNEDLVYSSDSWKLVLKIFHSEDNFWKYL